MTQSDQSAPALRAALREQGIGRSAAGGFYCKVCDSPAWSRPEQIDHREGCVVQAAFDEDREAR